MRGFQTGPVGCPDIFSKCEAQEGRNTPALFWSQLLCEAPRSAVLSWFPPSLALTLLVSWSLLPGTPIFCIGSPPWKSLLLHTCSLVTIKHIKRFFCIHCPLLTASHSSLCCICSIRLASLPLPLLPSIPTCIRIICAIHHAKPTGHSYHSLLKSVFPYLVGHHTLHNCGHVPGLLWSVTGPTIATGAQAGTIRSSVNFHSL